MKGEKGTRIIAIIALVLSILNSLPHVIDMIRGFIDGFTSAI